MHGRNKSLFQNFEWKFRDEKVPTDCISGCRGLPGVVLEKTVGGIQRKKNISKQEMQSSEQKG
jgi:hypothetical protein